MVFGMLRCIAMHREYGAWGAAPGMQRGYDAFNPDGRADYSVIHGITKSR